MKIEFCELSQSDVCRLSKAVTWSDGRIMNIEVMSRRRGSNCSSRLVTVKSGITLRFMRTEV